jgi:hypothetical protein
MSAVAVNLVAFTQAIARTLARRLALAGIAGAWVGLASGLGAAGKLSFAPENPVPLIAVLLAVPLAVVGVLVLRSPRVRTTLLSIPTSLLIGLNSMRVLGVMFLLLAATGGLSGPFPYFAGLGDIITGAFAIPLALSVARSGLTSSSSRAIRWWNLFGTLDLVVAVTLGITSANGSPLQLIHAGIGSGAVQYLPYCLIPTVLVPFYLITHGIIGAQIAVARTASTGSALSHA